MSKNTNPQPLIGRVTENDPVERSTISLKLSTRKELEAYRVFYEDAMGDEIVRQKLIEEFVKMALGKDTGFAAWKKANPAKVRAAFDTAERSKGDEKEVSHVG